MEESDAARIAVHALLVTDLFHLLLEVIARKLSPDSIWHFRLFSSACFTACDRARRLVI